MTNILFRKTAKDWSVWACQSAKLAGDCLKDEDEPRLRSCYILLSYAFELMLKSRLVAVSNITETDITQKYGHGFVKILKELASRGELGKIGIRSLPKKVKDYIYSIEMIDDGVFYVHDFTNIRYYPKPLKDSWDTAGTVRNTAKIMVNISGNIHNLWRGI